MESRFNQTVNSCSELERRVNSLASELQAVRKENAELKEQFQEIRRKENEIIFGIVKEKLEKKDIEKKIEEQISKKLEEVKKSYDEKSINLNNDFKEEIKNLHLSVGNLNSMVNEKFQVNIENPALEKRAIGNEHVTIK